MTISNRESISNDFNALGEDDEIDQAISDPNALLLSANPLPSTSSPQQDSNDGDFNAIVPGTSMIADNIDINLEMNDAGGMEKMVSGTLEPQEEHCIPVVEQDIDVQSATQVIDAPQPTMDDNRRRSGRTKRPSVGKNAIAESGLTWADVA
ncbi:hypothetical protein D9758_004608 [Tetrapyrgos nigripes]|uniref:Uncharacterized protein n=1 Tax=Tetrapyrgos nigripes TaxID=182062 RepID=A0A8H5GZU6_9AGAR|nr:hypothetical protein D9758_004608 [Tetrapyrgos nigripes]